MGFMLLLQSTGKFLKFFSGLFLFQRRLTPKPRAAEIVDGICIGRKMGFSAHIIKWLEKLRGLNRHFAAARHLRFAVWLKALRYQRKCLKITTGC